MGISISRAEMTEYLNKIHMKTVRVFASLKDEDMARSIIKGVENYTYTEEILAQIRHIMYNIGYGNSCLRENGLPESDWYAYNEKEDE